VNASANPNSHDALWLAARGAPASLVFVNDVQSAVGDIDAAMKDEDWPTAVEACDFALRSVYFCRLVLDGLERRCQDGELDLLLATDDDAVANQLRHLPSSLRAGEADARRGRGLVNQAVTELEDDLPIRMPVIRTSRGYFPSVRIGADIERLRASCGLPPIDWMAWL